MWRCMTDANDRHNYQKNPSLRRSREQKMFMPTSAKKYDAKVLPTNSTTPKWVNPIVNSLNSLIHTYFFGGKIKTCLLNMLSKQVRISEKLPARPEHDRDDRITNMPKNQWGKKSKHVSKAWTWQGWPENKHAKQWTCQANMHTNVAARKKIWKCSRSCLLGQFR